MSLELTKNISTSNISTSCWYNLYLILKPSGPVQQYFFHLWSKMNGNQLLDWLRDIWFMDGLQISFCKNKQTNKQKNQCSPMRLETWQHDEQEKQATKRRAEKYIGRLKYFYIEESIPCTNFRARITPFVCMLHARS